MTEEVEVEAIKSKSKGKRKYVTKKIVSSEEGHEICKRVLLILCKMAAVFERKIGVVIYVDNKDNGMHHSTIFSPYRDSMLEMYKNCLRLKKSVKVDESWGFYLDEYFTILEKTLKHATKDSRNAHNYLVRFKANLRALLDLIKNAIKDNFHALIFILGSEVDFVYNTGSITQSFYLNHFSPISVSIKEHLLNIKKMLHSSIFFISYSNQDSLSRQLALKSAYIIEKSCSSRALPTTRKLTIPVSSNSLFSQSSSLFSGTIVPRINPSLEELSIHSSSSTSVGTVSLPSY